MTNGPLLVGLLVIASIKSALCLPCSKSGCPQGGKCILQNCLPNPQCPKWTKYGKGPSTDQTCNKPIDPNSRPPSGMEKWFTKEIFEDLFPKANLGWGPNPCLPYSYESFVIAARYFPKFGAESPENGLSKEDNYRRDLAAFFAHAVQETGENDLSLYTNMQDQEKADGCFFRGGMFNWFEGGPTSGFLDPQSPGHAPKDGNKCRVAGRYCSTGNGQQCGEEKEGEYFKQCYFGRGPIQLSYNYNYAKFAEWLKSQNIQVDVMKEPNLLITNKDPPLAIMASLWFYMTPQPPKPSMHDIVLGKWKAGPADVVSNYTGPAFGPTSLVINNECGGEEAGIPTSPGESRRIKAFKWLSKYFGFKLEREELLSCKNMQAKFDSMQIPISYQLDWSGNWRSEPCDCAPANYGGPIPYFEPGYYDQEFVDTNEANRKKCVESVYENPAAFKVDTGNSPCLNVPIKKK